MAALAVPLALPSGATATIHTPYRAAAPDAPSGSTHTLMLAPLATSGRALGSPLAEGLTERSVKPFSLLGVTWEDARTDLEGTVQVRTRAVGTGAWSAWRDIESHSEDAPDAGSPEATESGVRGATAPLWVGRCDGVEVRVVPKRTGGVRGTLPALPKGLRLDMVDPGDDPPGAPSAAPSTAGAPPSGADPVPAVTPPDPTDEPANDPARPGSQDRPGDTGSPGGAGDPTDSGTTGRPGDTGGTGDTGDTGDEPGTPVTTDPTDTSGTEDELPVVPALTRAETEALTGRTYIGPRPRIVTRAGWHADESLRTEDFLFTDQVDAMFVHHSATGNDYDCSDAPSLIRSIYRYHINSSGWRDIGYNFLVDKCGTIYEGRGGGVAKAVFGAHTLGFNADSMGVAVLGTFSDAEPSEEALDAVARLAAWKLGIYGHNPAGTAYLLSGGSNKYRKGVRVSFNSISGHRDGFATECPGTVLYDDLGYIRRKAAALQGR
ncbi:N-acetylmuramoyl-L-alanine amidase [Streptomyces sp. MI02-7b]|uniref:N-acetylmuramoyl-L-alanine amidase n=1 Tax=Streptomyces sp. MI02-7b TaxID=462941 RepID=UPI0029A1A9E2|nr:N-acetylmuramoyl-L-alanine amidase [Streptomyces sp. MI02-7b]MDX3074778.1 N-acetylmuramoyl-L-alanine amidase [Streptomyces sp. MI02-7b]